MKTLNAKDRSRKKSRIGRKIVLWVLILYAVAGFIVIPAGLKHYLPGILTPSLGRPVTINYVRLNPFSLSVTIGGVKIAGENQADFISIGRLYGNLQLSSIWHGGPVVKLVEIQKPSIHIIKKKDGTFNFSDLAAGKPGASSSPPASGSEDKGPKVSFDLHRLSVKDADIHYRDNGLSFRTDVAPLDINLTHITNIPGQMAEFDISGKTAFHESFHVTGSLRLDPLLVKGRIETANIDLTRYAPFYSSAAGVVVTKGTADVQASFIYPENTIPDGKGELVYDAFIKLASLSLANTNQQDKPILTLPEFTVSGISLSPARKNLHIENVTTTGAAFHIERFADGELNITPHSESTGKSADETPKDTMPDDKQKKQDSPGWTADIDKISVGRYVLHVTDNVPAEPVALDINPININGISFSNRPGSTGDVSFSFKTGKGIFAARGRVSLTPLSVDLDIKADHIGIVTAAPYIKEKVGLNITDGNVNAAGHMSVRAGDQGLSGGFTGNVALADFSAADKTDGDALVNWTNLAFSDMNLSLQPLSISMKNISLVEPKLNVVRLPGGALNLLQAFKPAGQEGTETAETGATPESNGDQQPETPAKPASNSIPVDIKTIDLKSGTIKFADQDITPAFECTMSGMNLQVSNLLFPGAHQADFTFSGRFEDQADLNVSGKLFPLDLNRNTNVHVDFSNIGMPVFTPYFGHYLGYELKKGKLFLRLGYSVKQNRMSGENHVLFDKLYLGNSVDSPSAVNLPLKLALALLRDRNGKITMDVPVEGDVDSPEFRYGRVIYNAFTSLISKIATSPFAALGSMFADADKLGFVSFAPGSDVLVKSQSEKIRKLLDALYERPSLQLVIDPVADPVGDRRAFVDREFMKKIGEQILKKTGNKNKPTSFDALLALREKLSEKDYPAILTTACKKAGVKVSGVSEKELEQRLKASIVISDQALLKLAQKRGGAVRDVIRKANKVDPARIFLTNPRIGSASRVAFKLKAE